MSHIMRNPHVIGESKCAYSKNERCLKYWKKIPKKDNQIGLLFEEYKVLSQLKIIKTAGSA